MNTPFCACPSTIRGLLFCGAQLLAVASVGQTALAQTQLVPQLVVSTYLGGDGRDSANAVAVDRDGNVYVAGNTAFGDLDTGNVPLIEHLPPRPPFFPPGSSITSPDGFLAKFAPDLKSVKYFAVIGGSLIDHALAVAVDAQGNVVVLLRTESTDFPTQNPIQAALQGDSGLAIIKLSPDGQRVIFSTYLGGDSQPVNFAGKAALAVDQAGQIYVAGSTFSQNFPVTNGAFQRQSGVGLPNGFVAKISADGSRLIYATYLGGNGHDECTAITVDADGNAYIGGRTASMDFPLVKPINASAGVALGSSPTATLFLARLNTLGTALDFSTLLIGDGSINALALTPQRGLVLAGSTAGGLTTTPNALQRAAGGGLVLELNPQFTAVAYASHLGGSSTATGLAIDGQGRLAVTGLTSGSLVTTHEGFGESNSSFSTGADAFVVKLDSSRSVIYSTTIRGQSTDHGLGLAFLANGALVMVGNTQSFDFPQASPVRAFPISDEGFVLSITDGPPTGPGAGQPQTAIQTYADRQSANLLQRFYRIRNVAP